MTSDAERSLKQVLAYRDKLANSLEAHDAEQAEQESQQRISNALMGPPAPAAAPAPVDVSEQASESGDPRASPTSESGGNKPRRSRNASFFD